MYRQLKTGLLVIVFITTLAGPFLFAQESDFGQGSTRQIGQVDAEVHYLSYQAMSKVADSIVAKLLEKNSNPGSLIICGSKECDGLIQARLSYEIYNKEVDELIAEFNLINNPTKELVADLKSRQKEPVTAESATRGRITAAGRRIEGISGIVTPSTGLLIDSFRLINLLRSTKIRIKSNTETADDSFLSTAIVAKIKSRPETSGINVYLPAYSQMANVAVTENSVYKKYQTLLSNLRTGEKYDAVFDLFPNNRVSDEEREKIASLRTLNRRTRDFLQSLSSQQSEPALSNDVFDPALEQDKLDEPPIIAMDKKPSGSVDANLEVLEGLIIGERFASMLKESAMILRVKVIKLLGTRVSKDNLILGNRIRFSGSATVQYVFTDNSGNLVYADTLIVHTGFKKMSEVRGDN